MDRSDMPPMNAGAPTTHSHRVTSWKRQPSLEGDFLEEYDLPAAEVKRLRAVHNIYTTPFKPFSPKVITSEYLCPQYLLISFGFIDPDQDGTIRLHPMHVHSQECVHHKWRALCHSANTQSKRPNCPPAQPAALFINRYLLSSPLFPPSPSLNS